MRRIILGAVVVLAVAGLVAGCGGDDETADTTASSTTVEAGSGGDDTTTTTAGSGGAGDAAFTSDECRQLAEAFDNDDLANSIQSGDDPTEQLEQTAQLLSEAADKVPDEVRGDVQTLAEVYAELASASADVDWAGISSGNPAAAVGAAQLAQVFATNTDFGTAAQNLSQWAQENCVPTT